MLDTLLRKIPVIAVSLAAQPFFAHADEAALNNPANAGQIANFMAFIPSRAHDDVKAKTLAIEERKVNGNLGTKQPSRFDGDKYNVIFDGEFLYWQAKQDGLEFSVKNNVPDSSTFFGSSTLDGKVEDIDFDWSPACRFMLGYHTRWDYWDFIGTWTHFHNGSGTNEKADSDGGLSTTWPLMGSSGTTPPGFDVSSASGRWHLCYDTLDLTLNRNYFVSHALTLTPKAGLRNAWIDQRTKYHYNLLTSSMGPEKVRLKNNFYGVGAFLGVDLSYYFNKSFSLWGKVAGSLLSGFFHIDETAIVEGLNSSGKPVSYSVEEHITKVAGNLETGIGLQWETGLRHDRSHMAFFAGFEFLLWMEQNQTRNFTYPGIANNIYFDSEGDLSLMGLTLGMRFDF